MLGMFAATLLPLVSATSATGPALAVLNPTTQFAVIDSAARQLPPSKTVASLAARLVRLSDKSIGRARAAYTWTTSHIAYGLVRRPSADATLITGTGDCDAHATLYAALCEAMGVECTRVVGYLRYPYAPGAALADVTKPLAAGQWLVLHAWNAVRVDGHWGLVDTTLGTAQGAVDPDDYFLPDPGVFATDHVPNDPTQALVRELPLDQLAKTPLLRPASWRAASEYKFSLADLAAADHETGCVVVHTPWQRGMRVALQTDAGSVEDAAFVQPSVEGAQTEIRFCPPKLGTVAWLGIESGGSWKPIAGYPVTGSTTRRLPTPMAQFYDGRATLEAPFDRDLAAGKSTTIRLRAPGASRVVAFQGPEVAGMFERDGDSWVLETTPSAGPAIQIMASYEDQSHFQGLLAYKVR